MATMTEVARLANVSIATVSAVLNRSSYVSPALIKRVEEAAGKLDYRVNLLARSLKQGSTQTVGMLIPEIAMLDPFFGEVVQGTEITLRAKSYSLLLGQTHNRVEEQSLHIAAFRARSVDGLLLFQAAGRDEELEKLIAGGKAVVFVGRLPDGVQGDAVATDIEAGTVMGVSHLIGKGHRRVALVTQKDSLSVQQFRLKGWRDACASGGRIALDNLHAEGELSAMGGRRAALQLLDQRPAPDAIFVDDLVQCIGVVQALQERGLAEEIEVLSSDDSDWLDVFHIPISTIVQPSHEVGVKAAELLLKRLRTPTRRREKILLKPTLKIRVK